MHLTQKESNMENVTGQPQGSGKPLVEIPENERKVAGGGCAPLPSSRSAHGLELSVGNEQLIPDRIVR
jgi:hypothetical protein